VRIRWFAVMFLLLAIGALAVGAEESLSDARHVFSKTLVYPNEYTRSMIQFIIFPENHKETLEGLSGSLRIELFELACDFDLELISFAQQNKLDYDRSWLLYWLPEPGEVITPKHFLIILYKATFMPPGFREIVYRDYSYESGLRALPAYRAEFIKNWDTRFGMSLQGYVLDPIAGEWVLNFTAAENQILRIRQQIAEYLGR